MLLRETIHRNKLSIKSLHVLSNLEKMRETTGKIAALLPSSSFLLVETI
jgi:hypothetical protein